ncbi:hypothetical protein [Pseudoalteromonas luteoviolacea]|uniref:Uncharacterized protein n=1 Tax=Pseudoalteromonas luteoviolacea S4054 TaxID=1129367 RepID=A0A0F6AEH5_9GAMM|nr:hypothetical protein [Pseudoalteromonas luteoviolacea]KKE84595.1 hypothetical protein N479_08500 [Pseudoalteromonas luteoviolacea S4054]KZN71260.1 hypothetical protein N481_18920 [Pseudoalteromonas luteoviolacea S4047-1]AOT10334.1 hypothetical protein S4054249_20865 [Pseudoalteromonas luteoviolacea]AOT15597.1 hypothetical protein S40542_22725 [Pseudoalteromonas luteoviolacea]AOT21059.1 hypothetical protein S4054_25705 [Pseudoalteromonas luteoviolacea]
MNAKQAQLNRNLTENNNFDTFTLSVNDPATPADIVYYQKNKSLDRAYNYSIINLNHSATALPQSKHFKLLKSNL